MLKAIANNGGGGGGGGGGNLTVSAGTNSVSAGLVSFSNSNGITFGMDPSGNITASVANTGGQTNQTLGFYATGNTTQNSSTTLDARTVSYNFLGAATGGFSNGSIDISVPVQTNQTAGFYALGNTTQNSSTTLDARTLSFNFLGIITGGYSNGSIDISATAAAQTNQSIGFYALGNTTQNSSTTLDARSVSFNGLGIITVGYSNGSIDLSATTAAQTNQSIGFYAVGNTTQNTSTTLDARTLSINGLGIITAGYSNGSIDISASQSAGTVGFYAIGNTTQNSSTTLDRRTVSFNFLGAATGGFSNGSIDISVPTQTNQSVGFYAVGNTTQNSSTTLDARTISINGLGIITAGYSNGSIDISASQSAGTVGFYAVGNTTQNSSTTLDRRTVSFNFLGAATGGFSNGSIDISVPSQTNQSLGFYAVGNTTQNSSTTLDARTLSINGLGIITAGYSNGSIDISATQSAQTVGFYAVGNTTQNSSTTLDARTISFDGLGAQTIGYSNGSIQLSVPATSSLVGVGGISISSNGSTISVSYLGQTRINDFAPWPLYNSTFTSFGQNTLNLGAFYPSENLSMNNVEMLISLTAASSASNSYAVSETISYALYSKGTGASTSQILSMVSSSIALIVSYNSNASAGYTISAGANSTTFSSGGVGSSTAWTGQKVFSMPFATSLSGQGEYWFGIANSTASTGGTNAFQLSHVGLSNMSNASWGNLATSGIAGSNKSIFPNQFGMILSVTSNAWPTTIAFSDMSNQVSNILPYILLAT